MLLDGYYHLCQLILCTVRIVSRRVRKLIFNINIDRFFSAFLIKFQIQFVYTPRHTYGLARGKDWLHRKKEKNAILIELVGVVGELVAFISFLSLSVSVFLESLKHVFDIIVVYPSREKNNSIVLTAHGKG